jgi:phytol kinase
MWLAALSLAVILVVLVAFEFFWRSGKLEPETARKLIHISVGSFIAFWPLYMSWTMIQVLCVLLFLGIATSYQLGVFGAIHSVTRRTSGELWYPIGIGLTAVLTSQPWIFCVAVLHMSLADGIAEIVGKKYGRMHYRIGLHTRSTIGSFAFLITSLGLCMLAYIVLHNELPGISLAVFAITPFLATSVESISRYGLDNLAIPVVVVFALGLPTGTLNFF